MLQFEPPKLQPAPLRGYQFGNTSNKIILLTRALQLASFVTCVECAGRTSTPCSPEDSILLRTVKRNQEPVLSAP